MEIKNQNRFRLKLLANVGKFSLLFSLPLSAETVELVRPSSEPPTEIPTLSVEVDAVGGDWSYSRLLEGLRSFASIDESGNRLESPQNYEIKSRGRVISQKLTRINDVVVEKRMLLHAPVGRYSYWRNITLEKEINFDPSVKIFDLVHVADAFLVSLNEKANNSMLQDFIKENNIKKIRQLSDENYIVLYVGIENFDSIIDIASNNNELFDTVSLLEPSRVSITTPNDTLFNAYQWYSSAQSNDSDIDATAAWDIRTSSGNVRVAVPDPQGVRYTHDDIDGNIINQYDFIDNDGNPTTSDPHGTLMAGILGAEGNNAQGVAGVAWDVDMLVARVNTPDDLIEAIDWADSNSVKIMNISFYYSSFISSLYSKMSSKNNIIFVCSAGNRGINIDTYNPGGNIVQGHPLSNEFPARFDLENIITVSGSNQSNNPWYTNSTSLTNTGVVHIDISAPADTVAGPSATNDGSYATASGTSASAALVSGALALVVAEYPNNTVTYYKNRIIHTAKSRSTLNSIAPEGRLLSVYNALTHTERWWMNDIDFGNGNKWNAMGFFYNLKLNDWIWHFDIGWLYSYSTSSSAVYYWDPVTEYWVYTGYGFYPYFQVYPTTGPSYTVWYNESNTPSFFNFSTNAYQNTF